MMYPETLTAAVWVLVVWVLAAPPQMWVSKRVFDTYAQCRAWRLSYEDNDARTLDPQCAQLR